jgi:hypothetical protein
MLENRNFVLFLGLAYGGYIFLQYDLRPGVSNALFLGGYVTASGNCNTEA